MQESRPLPVMDGCCSVDTPAVAPLVKDPWKALPSLWGALRGCAASVQKYPAHECIPCPCLFFPFPLPYLYQGFLGIPPNQAYASSPYLGVCLVGIHPRTHLLERMEGTTTLWKLFFVSYVLLSLNLSSYVLNMQTGRLLSKQKLVLLVASYVSLLNSSFLLLWRHTRTSAWPCTHHTISPLLLFLNTFLC